MCPERRGHAACIPRSRKSGDRSHCLRRKRRNGSEVRAREVNQSRLVQPDLADERATGVAVIRRQVNVERLECLTAVEIRLICWDHSAAKAVDDGITRVFLERAELIAVLSEISRG